MAAVLKLHQGPAAFRSLPGPARSTLALRERVEPTTCWPSSDEARRLDRRAATRLTLPTLGLIEQHPRRRAPDLAGWSAGDGTVKIDVRKLKALASPKAMRYSAFLVLLMARVLDTPTQQRIAANLGVSRASITQPVAPLVANGLLAVDRDPGDARAHLVTLTPAGAAAADAAWRGLDEHRSGIDDGVDEPARRAARSHSEQRCTDRGPMNVHEAGDPAGETLVFLHGGNVAGWMWGPQIPAFVDYPEADPRPARLRHEPPRDWLSIDDTADRLAVALADAAPRGLHVVGLSLGAAVAVELAARHPSSCEACFSRARKSHRPPRRSISSHAAMMRSLGAARVLVGHKPVATACAGADADVFVETGLGIRRETAIAIFDEVADGVAAAHARRDHRPRIAVAGRSATAQHPPRLRSTGSRRSPARQRAIAVGPAPPVEHRRPRGVQRGAAVAG